MYFTRSRTPSHNPAPSANTTCTPANFIRAFRHPLPLGSRTPFSSALHVASRLILSVGLDYEQLLLSPNSCGAFPISRYPVQRRRRVVIENWLSPAVGFCKQQPTASPIEVVYVVSKRAAERELGCCLHAGKIRTQDSGLYVYLPP